MKHTPTKRSARLARGSSTSSRPTWLTSTTLTCLSTTIVEALARRRIPCFFTLHDYWLLCHRGQLLDRNLQVCPGPEPDGCDVCLDDAAGVSPLGFSAAAGLRTAGRWLPAAPVRAARRVAGRMAQATTPPTAAATEAARRLGHMRQVANHVTHFLAPSHHFRNRFIAFGIAPDRITHAPYGFDHRPFRTVPRTESTHLRLGFLGSLMVSKAPHLLLEAFRGLEPDTATVDLFGAHVDYHGDDSYRASLAPLLDQAGVRLHGPVPHDQIPGTLASLDVLVVPSVWPENSPLVIHEAFLAGLPVVASRIGGIPELVTDGTNGLLFCPGDALDLRRTLSRLIDEPELMPTLRRGIPAVRTIEDDVATTRRLYQAHLAESDTPGSGDERHAVAAVVLNYGTPDDTALTVRSLLASRRPFDQVVVVDNHGSDGCRQALSSVGDQVTYIRTESNLGFSGGMNVGIRHALAPWSESRAARQQRCLRAAGLPATARGQLGGGGWFRNRRTGSEKSVRARPDRVTGHVVSSLDRTDAPRGVRHDRCRRRQRGQRGHREHRGRRAIGYVGGRRQRMRDAGRPGGL